MKEEEKVLRVAEARPKDVGRGVARVDPAVTQYLGLLPGDTVEIEGKKRTVAIIAPGYPEDENRGVIRIDGSTRRNAGVGIDEKVGLKKVMTKHAERIVFAPM